MFAYKSGRELERLPVDRLQRQSVEVMVNIVFETVFLVDD
jgi:hypothetical protein